MKQMAQKEMRTLGAADDMGREHRTSFSSIWSSLQVDGAHFDIIGTAVFQLEPIPLKPSVQEHDLMEAYAQHCLNNLLG